MSIHLNAKIITVRTLYCLTKYITYLNINKAISFFKLFVFGGLHNNKI